MTQTESLGALVDCSSQLESARKMGTAPMGHLERVLQTFSKEGSMEEREVRARALRKVFGVTRCRLTR
eukprot:44226-Pyramimonas_sp.AAC.1